MAVYYNGQAKRERRRKFYAEDKKRNNGGFRADYGNLPKRIGVYDSFRLPYAMGAFYPTEALVQSDIRQNVCIVILTKPGFTGCLHSLKERTPPMPI